MLESETESESNQFSIISLHSGGVRQLKFIFHCNRNAKSTATMSTMKENLPVSLKANV